MCRCIPAISTTRTNAWSSNSPRQLIWELFSNPIINFKPKTKRMRKFKVFDRIKVLLGITQPIAASSKNVVSTIKPFTLVRGDVVDINHHRCGIDDTDTIEEIEYEELRTLFDEDPNSVVFDDSYNPNILENDELDELEELDALALTDAELLLDW